MWLFAAFPALAAISTRIFYRLQITGARVAARGPVLLVANHPNSLLDPFLVAAAAKRPVRFLAKAPLLSDPLIGWGVRAAGSLPVYRRKEDPSLMARNEDTFRAVHEALGAGAAVAIFPEGISHDEPGLVPLKTGAARIALGAAPLTGGSFPIVPIGLVFEAKQEFRSRTHVVVGEPVEWSDLATRTVDDYAAVRELTARIQTALREVTVNLASWEDAPLIAGAVAVYDVEVEPAESADEEATRRIAAADTLAQLNADGDATAVDVAQRLREHMRTLSVLGVSPADLARRRDVGSAARWTLRKLSPHALLAAVIAALGTLVFWLPYRATRWMAERDPTPDLQATRKLLYGGVFFSAWIILLTAAAAVWDGFRGAVVAVFALPLLALMTIPYSERWTAAGRDVRTFLIRRIRARGVDELRENQRALGRDLRTLYLRARAARGIGPRDT